ncbi:MAG: glutamine synthetase [Desulfurococcaceae archaeon]
MTHVTLLYTDVAGYLRRVSVWIDGEPNTLSKVEANVDGSSILGFESVERSDVVVRPASSRILDLRRHGLHYAVFAGVFRADGTRHENDPRHVAEALESHLASMGLEARAGAEVEFYVVERALAEVGTRTQKLVVEASLPAKGLEGAARKAYNLAAKLPHEDVVEAVVGDLTSLGYNVSKVHRENGTSGQVELASGQLGPTELGDFVQLAKLLARLEAKERGLEAIFLPKPFHGDYGSGMHVHVSLWSGFRNLFEGLSEEARHFIGGILEHARSLAAFTNPTANSYRRLVEGFEAPVYVCWGVGNRSAMVRVPMRDTGRIEVRSPDPLANPYLAVAAIIMAGLDGIKRGLDPGEPVPYNVYRSPEGRIHPTIPRSLEEALDALESDNEYLKPVFSSSLIESYVELKRQEARLARSVPAPIDYVLYLDL